MKRKVREMESAVQRFPMEETKNRQLSFTSNQLKVLAIAAMTLDHCAAVFVPESLAIYPLLRMVGRLTAPIMCFLVAEGYYHTSNLRRYMGRLLMMAVVSQLPFALCFGFDPFRAWEAANVMWSLLMGLCALTAFESPRLALWQKGGLIGLCCLSAYSADWNYIAVLFILSFGAFRGQKNRQTIAHLAIGCLYVAQALMYGLSPLMRLGVFFSIPLLRQYNGQLGHKSKLLQWTFYWFYPFHLLLIFGILYIGSKMGNWAVSLL